MFNEADNVAPLAEQVIAALRAETRPFELVLVDDASTDATWDRITAASRADARVRGLRHGRNAGQSAALWTGFRNSKSPIIVTLDGDLQNDPADFPRLLAELEKYDVACGLRAFKRPVLDPLFAFNGFHRFMPVLAHSAGARVIEIPVNHRPRVAGVSKYGLWNRLGRGIVDLFAVRWFQKRLIPSIPISS